MGFKTNGSRGTKKAVSAVENSDKLWKVTGALDPEMTARVSGAVVCEKERCAAECR
jgi:hypothetical protein